MAWSWVTPSRWTDPPPTPEGVPVEVRLRMEDWRNTDNTVRPHSALGDLT